MNSQRKNCPVINQSLNQIIHEDLLEEFEKLLDEHIDINNLTEEEFRKLKEKNEKQ